MNQITVILILVQQGMDLTTLYCISTRGSESHDDTADAIDKGEKWEKSFNLGALKEYQYFPSV